MRSTLPAAPAAVSRAIMPARSLRPWIGPASTRIETGNVTLSGSGPSTRCCASSTVLSLIVCERPRTVATTSPGVAYPGDGPTAIHHVYEAKSRAGYTLTLTFVLDVRYRVNGGAWIELGPVQRPISRVYPVIEIRSIVTARG